VYGRNCDSSFLFLKLFSIFLKRGTYVQRKTTVRKFTADEIDKLPAKHAARINPNLEIERTVVSVVDMPVLSTVANREAVVCFGADPILISQEVTT